MEIKELWEIIFTKIIHQSVLITNTESNHNFRGLIYDAPVLGGKIMYLGKNKNGIEAVR